MSLDELINALLEAKEHCVDGKRTVEIIDRDGIYSTIDSVQYDNKYLTIKASLI